MNPDTQTFSDIMAIDTSSQICLQIKIAAEEKYQLTINNQIISDKNSITYWDLLAPLEIKIKNLSLYGSVVIKKISVNNLEILPKFCHLSSNKSHSITKPGSWSFVISEPFYIWYHQVAGYGMVA